jgi:hypothetical protein
MANLRLVLLRWKMESRAWLEAIWEGRWSGIVLTGAATIVCACLFYLVPAPGVSVAVMGVTAAIMAARTKATGAEKAAWMLIISALLVIEVGAIKKERFFNEQTEKSRAEEERQHFGVIGQGIETTITQSQKQFEETIGLGQQQFNATLDTEKGNLAQTLRGLKETVNAATGGDSFCYVILVPDYGYGANGSVPSSIIQQGKYPLTNVTASITDDDMIVKYLNEGSKHTAEDFSNIMERAQQWVHVGDLPPQFSEQFSMRAATVTEDRRLLTITFWANNGHWIEKFGLRRVNGKWLRLIRVWRERLDKKKNAYVADVIFNRVDDGYPQDANTKTPSSISADPTH